jgi:uncharacterized delta-60 repeat protein
VFEGETNGAAFRERTGKLVAATAALVATALAALLVCAGVASAQGQDNRPIRLWSFTELQQPAGNVKVAGASQVGGILRKRFDFGSAAFNFPESDPRGVASGSIFSTASGKSYGVLAQAPSANPSQPRATNGGGAHLDQFQAYEKRSDKASLRITITKAVVDAIDANHGLLPSECPSGFDCNPIRGVVRFKARAYAESAGGDFFRAGGLAYIEGHEGRWTITAVTSSDSRRPLWDDGNFSIDDDVDDIGTKSHAIAELAHRVTMNVPLSALRNGELFAVHVRLDAETLDRRGRESAVEAFIQDPQKVNDVLVKTTGLKARGAPAFHEPPVKTLPAATCPAGSRRKAARLQFSAPAYVTDEATGVPMFALVTRTGATKGRASATVRTSAGSAQAGRDYTQTSTTVRFADGDTSPRLVEIPILQDDESERGQTFSVSLSHPHCARLGKQSRAEVTIVDDDSPPAPPASFTIGGAVDGLQGSGLVLDDIGTELAVGNGPFTFPGTRADGLPYDVRVKTQPRGPDQVCTVSHGAGTVTGADVNDVAVHCAAPASPAGLDPTFGSDGRVSTPVGAGKAEGVLIQSDGSIITAGRRAVNGGIDFALTRHDADGKLDTGFGTGGIVTTDLGSATDEGLDAALLEDDGFVVVGRTDGPGFNRNFAIARYHADGTLDRGFGGDGIVTTDFAAQVDQANSVAVQPDGKVVVAGLAARTGALGADNDFAIARYLGDGTLDTSFGGDGIVTTDLGTRTDMGRAVAIQPGDGGIVVAGTTEDDVALVRYAADGDLDTSFGTGGVRITDLGSDDFANAIALTGDGQILVAGHTLGSAGHLDFSLARYTAGGGLDQSFGTGGVVKTDFGTGDDFAEGVTVDSDGRIVVVGRATSSTILDMAVARYHADGTLDTGFGTNGKITADFHGKGEFGQDVAIQPDGKIVAAGYTANGIDTEFALMRIKP